MKRNYVYGLFIKLVIYCNFITRYTLIAVQYALVSAQHRYNTDVSRADCYINCFNNYVVTLLYICMCVCATRNGFQSFIHCKTNLREGRFSTSFFFFFSFFSGIKELYYHRLTAIFSNHKTRI